MMIVTMPSTPMGILTMMNPPTQGTNLADLAMKAASAAATNHSAWFPKSSLLYLQVRNCIFVKICIFVLCMISLQLIFFQISVELLGSATFSSLMVFVATVMFASICLIVFVPGRKVWSRALSYKSAVKSGEIVGNANTWALKLFLNWTILLI